MTKRIPSARYPEHSPLKEHGNVGRARPFAGGRYSVKGKRKQQREDEMTRRILIGLRRIRFKAFDVTARDPHGIRSNGINIECACSDYVIRFAVVLPGRKPDDRQREAIERDPLAVYTCSAPEAVRLASVGIVQCDAFGRLLKKQQ